MTEDFKFEIVEYDLVDDNKKIASVIKSFMALSENNIIAQASIRFDRLNFIRLDLNVNSEHRKMGIGKKLIQSVLEFGKEVESDSIIFDINDEMFEFMSLVLWYQDKHKIQPKFIKIYFELDLSIFLNDNKKQFEVLTNEVERIKSQLIENNISFLFFENNQLPDAIDQNEFLISYAETLSLRPIEDLSLPKIVYNKERFEKIIQERMQQQNNSLYLLLMDNITNEIIGFTNISFSRIRPTVIAQHFTGVKEKFHNKGYGTQLKKIMLLKVIEMLPTARKIQTACADSNKIAIAINKKLGFKEIKLEFKYQVKISKLEKIFNDGIDI